MNKDAGRKWPVIIAVSIVGVIIACVVTIKVALEHPVEMSDYGMQNYHAYDANVNEIIAEKIAFDRQYSIAFVTPRITEKGTVISYRVTDREGNAINDATIDVVLTRPDTTDYNIDLDAPSVADGTYTFAPVDLPKAGRWDILAKVHMNDVQRYYNLKADTRNSETFEF